ncbi:MAG: hypothetical protein INQ03_15870 [Candidatus Heimdallarchaeota archaeon]|nr:hypothetical protein [Candidatus Heimdallarchaeota archaeon]
MSDEFFKDNQQTYKEATFMDYINATNQFTKVDWIKYIGWVGMMLGLGIATLVFLLIGQANGANYPSYVWLIPIGTFGFTFAISLDNIGHTILYADRISHTELTIHKFTTTNGVLSTIFLILGYAYHDFFFIPILITIALSIFYSFIDEAIHWIRFSQGGSGIIEVTMHFLIMLFHPMMIFAWLYWYIKDYPGVAETLAALGV